MGAADAEDAEQAAARAAAAAASRLSQAFEAILQRILGDFQDTDPKVRDGMESGMRKMFERPYQEEMGVLEHGVGAAPFDLEEAQRVIFCPLLSDMRIYVAAFASTTPEATARRAMLMKFKLMSVFYTLHRKDGTLVDRFLHCGGLQALARMLAEEHPVIQSQAVELLMEFLGPILEYTGPPSSDRQALLHHEVFSCFMSRHFWMNLAKIIGERHETFPKSHANCIRIMGSAVGWLRPATEDGVPERGLPPDGLEAAQDALQHFLECVPTSPDIRGIAEDLQAGLKEVPRVRADPLQGAELAEAMELLFSKDSEAREDAAHAWQSLRRLGNEAFSAGLVWPAEASYRLSLEAGGSAVPASEASLICSNRALVLLKAGHHEEAAAAAAIALEHNPRNAKAAYRRAQALLELSSPDASAVRAAAEAAELAATLEPKDAKVAETLRQARERLAALPPPSSSPPAPQEEEQPEALDGMD